MNQNSNFADKWSRMFSQQDEVIEEDQNQLPEEGEELPRKQVDKKKMASYILRICYHFRKVIMAVPVVLVALRLAAYNMQNLPEQVGIDLQANGEFARMISRQTAVSWPLMVTGGCLALMFLSRKTVYPWLISLFSLILPVLLLLTNLYPA